MQRQDLQGLSGLWFRSARVFIALICLVGMLSFQVASGASLRRRNGNAAAVPVTYTATRIENTGGFAVMNGHGAVFSDGRYPPAGGGYLWKEGVLTDIAFNSPSRLTRFIGGINDADQVVGQLIEVPSGIGQAFLWQDTNGNHRSDESELVTFGELDFDATYADGINNFGQVLIRGQNTGSDEVRLFLWTPTVQNGSTGALTDLGNIVNDYYELNDYGQVGVSRFVDGTVRAFLWTPDTRNGSTGQFLDIPVLNGTSNRVTAISEAGAVVGGSDDRGRFTAFLWKPDTANGTTGQLFNLHPPQARDGVSVRAKQVNSRNQVVVEQHVAVKGGGADGLVWLWEDGVFQTLGTAGVDLTARALRDAPSPAHPQVIGTAGEFFTVLNAFVWDQGTLLDLNAVTVKPADWKLIRTLSINASGQILVVGTIGESAIEQVFLLTPQFRPDRSASISGPAETLSGTSTEFTITVRNTGEGAATGNVLRITLPSGASVAATSRPGTVEQGVLSAALPDLPAGDSAVTDVELVFATPGEAPLSVTVEGGGSDANPADDTVTHPLTVLSSAANRTVEIAGPTVTHVGSPTSFDFTIRNEGQTTSTGNALRVTLPEGTAIASATRAGTLLDGVFTVALPSLAFESEAATRITLIPGSAGLRQLQASVTGNEADTNPADDAAQHQLTVLAIATGPDLTGAWDPLTRRQQGPKRRPGQLVRGVLQVRNVGTGTAGRSTVRFFLSSDGVLDEADVVVGTQKVPALNAAKLRKLRFSKVFRNTPAAYVTGKRLIAVLDADDPGRVTEADETNNTVISAPLP